jgi:hypothetical protein
MRGLGGKGGATDPDHNHGRGTCDHPHCRRSNSSPALLSDRSLEPALTAQALPGLVSGVVEPPQGLQIRLARSLLSQRARRPAPSVRYPNKPWIPLHLRQDGREYPHVDLPGIGQPLSARSAPKALVSPAVRKVAPPAERAGPIRLGFVILLPFRAAHSECDRGSGAPLRPETE